MNNPQASPELASLRVQIDNIDQQLLTLLNQRALVQQREQLLVDVVDLHAQAGEFG